jgi:hypothetical protein
MHAVTVESYAEFRDDVRAFGNGKYNFLMVIGWAGIGKTETALAELSEEDFLYVRTKLTAFEFYCQLWEAEKAGLSFVVVDDVKALFRNKDALSLLTALTETRKIKRLSWNTASVGNSRGRKDAEGDEIPNSFETDMRLLLIVNEWETLGEDVRALESRGTCVIFEPTPYEVHLEVARGGWFKDQEVYDAVHQYLKVMTKPSMRHYVAAAEQKAAGRPWRKRLLEWVVGSEKLQQVLSLLQDSALKSDRARAKAFEERGWGSERTFWRLKKEFAWYDQPEAVGPNLKLDQRSGR